MEPPSGDDPIPSETNAERDACNLALRQEMAEGLLYTHSRFAEARQNTQEAASFVYALIELLNERGLISIEELDERKREVAARLEKKNREKGVGVLLQEPEYDKYEFAEEAAIDCASRIALCRAACCRLPFALSRQDIREGIVHWDLGQPYIVAQGQDGYCSHLEPGACRCTIHAHRPVPCRAFDCRRDKTIWLDFAKGIVNPDILRPDWPRDTEPSSAGGER